MGEGVRNVTKTQWGKACHTHRAAAIPRLNINKRLRCIQPAGDRIEKAKTVLILGMHATKGLQRRARGRSRGRRRRGWRRSCNTLLHASPNCFTLPQILLHIVSNCYTLSQIATHFLLGARACAQTYRPMLWLRAYSNTSRLNMRYGSLPAPKRFGAKIGL